MTSPPTLRYVPRPPLSGRETAVARRVALGLTQRAIAIEMGMSIKTVQYHVDQIHKELRLNSVALLTHWAIAHGLVSLITTYP